MQWLESSLFPDSEFFILKEDPHSAVWVNQRADGMWSIQIIGDIGALHSVDGQYPTLEAAQMAAELIYG